MDLSNILLILLSSLTFSISFPKYGYDFFILAAFIPLFFVLDKKPDKRFKNGFIFGSIAYTSTLSWLADTISNFGGLPTISAYSAIFILGAYFGLYSGIFALLFPDTKKHPFLSLLIIPGIWTGLDFISSFLLSGFPWTFAGYTLHSRLNFIQIANITGVYGVTFSIIFINTAIFMVLKDLKNKKRNTAILLSTAVFISSAYLYGKRNIKNIEEIQKNTDHIELLLAQGNIPPDEKVNRKYIGETIEKYLKLTSKGKYDIAVWPETALPLPLENYRPLLSRIKKHASKYGAQIVGTLNIKKGSEKHSFIMKNRALFVDRNGQISSHYDKIHLVPFGEYVPLKDTFPFLTKFIVPAGEFTSGDPSKLLYFKDKKISAKICFEIIFPGLVRKDVKNGAEMIINMTNDAWFGNSSGPYQHLAISTFRAIENGRAIARCANTGISAFISPTGRIIKRSELFETTAIKSRLPFISKQTIYTRYGDFFAYICLFMVIFQGFFKIHNHSIRRRYKNEC